MLHKNIDILIRMAPLLKVRAKGAYFKAVKFRLQNHIYHLIYSKSKCCNKIKVYNADNYGQTVCVEIIGGKVSIYTQYAGGNISILKKHSRKSWI
jgi:hypothetical protein